MKESSRKMDILVAFFSLLMIVAVTFWLWHNGTFTLSMRDDPQLTWHLIRSTGITAHILLTMSLIWGLVLNSQIVKNWSPGQVSMVMHSTVSWLAITMVATHALLLLTDDYFAYLLTDLIVPFRGPYRPLAVGLGTLALWISLIVAVSFNVRKRMGQHAWKWLHRSSYIAFLLATAHGLFAGTDAEHLGFRLWLFVGVILSVILLGYRLGRQQNKVDNKKARRTNHAHNHHMDDPQVSNQQ